MEFEEKKSECGLMPAPSVTEEAYIYEILADDHTPRLAVDPFILLNKTVEILADYRGCLLYTEGGLCIHRFHPVSGRVNQYTCDPIPGSTEHVKVGDWFALVQFL